MTKRRHLPVIALSITLLLPVAAVAQERASPSPSPAPTAVVEDTRLAEIEALVPEQLAGLPLRENLQLATGEQLSGQMSDEERAVFDDLLSRNGKGISDYAAANIVVPITDTTAVVIQPHRVTGIDAAGTLDGWLELLSLDVTRPEVTAVEIAGQDVRVFSSAAQPDFPRLHIFAAQDVVWMVVAEDDALVEEAVRVLSAAVAAGETEEPSAG